MKPKTKLQYRVIAANEQLQPFTAKPINWAFKHCITHYAFRTKGGVATCMDCGHQWELYDTKVHCRCPHCHSALEVKDTAKRTYKERIYFSVIDVQSDLQVQRVFRMDAVFHKRKAPKNYTTEVARIWIDEKGKTEVTGLRRTLGYYYDCFAMDSHMELRQTQSAYLYIADCYVYPRCRVLPQLSRNGLNTSFFGIAPQRLMTGLLTDSRIETMVKANDIEALRYFINHPKELDTCWASYKITMRNKYHITDIQMWADYIRMLAQTGKDLRNAYYVCPANLQAEHDKIQTRLQAIQEQEKRAEQRLEAQAAEADFEEMKHKFFGLSFTDGTIVVSVLESVDAYYQEGNAMHHCVGQCKYYNHSNSLVFSARIDGERIETVELSLDTFKVLQSRGVCNQNSPYHDDIIALVQNNVEQVRKRMTA